jgi:hypothetical protein
VLCKTDNIINKVTSELKSAMKIIEMLKEMFGVTDTIVSNDKSNFDDHYGRLLLTPNANQKRRKLTDYRNIHLHLLALLIVLKFYITPKTKLCKLNQLQSYL